MIGYIEEIGTGRKKDTLMISNGKTNAWIFSIFTGYEQLGTFKVDKPHLFEEGKWVNVTMDNSFNITKVKRIKHLGYFSTRELCQACSIKGDRIYYVSNKGYYIIRPKRRNFWGW